MRLRTLEPKGLQEQAGLQVDTSVPVVVLGGGYGDVAIARTLGRLGVPLYLIGDELSLPIWASRYWAKKTRFDFSRSEEEWVNRLLELGEAIGTAHGARPILLTVADWVSVFIERNSDALEERFLFPRPLQPIRQRLLNKWEMHVLAEEHRIPSPATALPASLEDIEAFLESHQLPILMKLADPYAKNRPGTKMIRSRHELMAVVGELDPAEPLNMVLQEYIPGDADSVWMCNGYFSDDPARTLTFTGKKLRQVSDAGVASLAVCVPNETVAAQTRRFMTELGYRGCVGIGWRYDRRDGLYKLLDVNARVSSVFRLFVGTNEMDVVRACYLDLTGQSACETALQPGRKWMLERDIVSAARAYRRGRLTIADWVRSVRGVEEWHWFAPDDPVPFLACVLDGSRRASVDAVRRLVARGR